MTDRGCTLITGAGGGLGSSVALALAVAGRDVVATDRNPASLNATVVAINDKFPGRAAAIAAELTDAAACRRVAAFAEDRFARLGALVHVAGIGPGHLAGRRAAFWELEPADWTRMVETNVNGSRHIAAASVDRMLRHGFGRVVVVGTSIATMRAPHLASYGATKAALEAAVLSWSRELDGTGITVNTVVPGGPVDTDFLSAETRNAAASGERSALLPPTVLDGPVTWLTSEEATVTGTRVAAARWDPHLTGASACVLATEPSPFEER